MPATEHVDLRLILRSEYPSEFPTPNRKDVAPRTATQAAALLTTQGKHVHVVSEGEAHCPAGLCTPAIVAGLLGTTPRSRPHLDSPHPLT